MLFIRVDRRQVAYYWIKKNKFSKYMLLDIEGSYLPLRFFISNIYFYVQLIICISLYVFVALNPFELEINVQVFTFWIVGIFNLLPIITFAIFEAIENEKCKDIKLY
jgi:hypothetical protein